jgi:hypothetical protein
MCEGGAAQPPGEAAPPRPLLTAIVPATRCDLPSLRFAAVAVVHGLGFCFARGASISLGQRPTLDA